MQTAVGIECVVDLVVPAKKELQVHHLVDNDIELFADQMNVLQIIFVFTTKHK